MNSFFGIIFDSKIGEIELGLLILACLRILYELMPEKAFPVTTSIWGQKAKKFHRLGLILAVGVIITTAPGILLS